MGSSQRLAAVAAVSHARHYYNLTQPDVEHAEAAQYSVNVFFISATLCGVLVAVCAACWPRSAAPHKPERTAPRGVYTVSGELSCQRQVQEELREPPPAYDTVVDDVSLRKDCQLLQEVITEPRDHCVPNRPDSGGLPSYEAAVMLKDTKL